MPCQSINQSITYVEHVFVFLPFFSLFFFCLLWIVSWTKWKRKKTNKKKFIYFASYSFVNLFIFNYYFFLSFLFFDEHCYFSLRFYYLWLFDWIIAFTTIVRDGRGMRGRRTRYTKVSIIHCFIADYYFYLFILLLFLISIYMFLLRTRHSIA